MPSRKQFLFLIKSSFAISLEFTLISDPVYPPLSSPFKHRGHFFSYGTTLIFFPRPRTITLSLLLPRPSPAANTYSSSHRSQPKCTSLEGFPDYLPLVCPHSTLCFSLVMKCLCSLKEGPYLSSRFPSTLQTFHKVGAQ